MDAIVRTEGLCKSFGSIRALSDISLEIRRGEIFGIIGPDGAGKSTLERIICTLCDYDSGSCVVDGHDAMTDPRSIHRVISYVPAVFSLYSDLTVEENIRFQAEIYGFQYHEDLLSGISTYRQLEPFRKRLAGRLSGGMKQKLAICCAIIHKPDILVLDEVTTGIDTVSRAEIIDMLREVNEKFGTTVILSTPYRMEIRICDRVAKMKAGSITAIGTPDEVLEPDTFNVNTSGSARDTEKIIEVHNLVKTFDSFNAVDDISFDVRRGEVFGFLGANGAGKTTAIKILCGLMAPTSGTATIAGYDIHTQIGQIRHHIGYMGQKAALYPELSVRENMEFFAGIYGIGYFEARKRIREQLEKVGMEEALDRRPDSLPLGWKQRITFAIATIHHPDVLFLDEPTSGVDIDARTRIWEIIREEANRGTTIFITTHNMDEAMYCDRQSIMVNGRIRAMGNLYSLVNSGVATDFYDVFNLITQAYL